MDAHLDRLCDAIDVLEAQDGGVRELERRLAAVTEELRAERGKTAALSAALARRGGPKLKHSRGGPKLKHSLGSPKLEHSLGARRERLRSDAAFGGEVLIKWAHKFMDTEDVARLTAEPEGHARSLAAANAYVGRAPDATVVGDCIDCVHCKDHGDETSIGGPCPKHIDKWHDTLSKCMHCKEARDNHSLFHWYRYGGEYYCPFHCKELEIFGPLMCTENVVAFKCHDECKHHITGVHFGHCVNDMKMRWDNAPWRFIARAHVQSRELLREAGQCDAASADDLLHRIAQWITNTCMYRKFHLCRGNWCNCENTHRGHGVFAQITADIVVARARLETLAR